MIRPHNNTAEAVFLTPPDKIALIAFLFSAAVTSATIAMPFLVYNQLGRGALLSGIFAGAQGIGYTASALVSSKYVTRAKNGLIWGVIGIIGFTVFMSIMPLFRTPWISGFFYAGAFTFSALAWPALHSWAGTEQVPKKRIRYMGRINVGWSAGGAAGPFLAGPLYELDYRLPYLFVAILCLWSLYLILRVPPESVYFEKRSAEPLHLRSAHDQASEAFLWSAWCSTFTAHLCLSAVRSVFPKRLDDIIAAGSLRFFAESDTAAWLNHAAATRFSWLAVATGLSTAFLFYVLGRSGWWHHRFSVMAASQMLAGFALYALGYTHSLLLMAAAFSIIGANLGVAFFSSVYYGTTNPDRKHGRSAINEGVVGAGGIAGSFGFALTGAYFGMQVPYFAMPILIVGIIIFQFILIRKRTVSPRP